MSKCSNNRAKLENYNLKKNWTKQTKKQNKTKQTKTKKKKNVLKII